MLFFGDNAKSVVVNGIHMRVMSMLCHDVIPVRESHKKKKEELRVLTKYPGEFGNTSHRTTDQRITKKDSFSPP